MTRGVLLLALALTACDHYEERHAQQCAAWMQRARNASDSLNVEVGCETQAQAHRAEVAANTAAGMSGAAIGMAASRK